MGTHLALISLALLLSTFPLSVLKVVAWMWIGAALSLLAVLGVAIIARSLILPFADPDLYRLIGQPERAPLPVGKNYRWNK